MSKYFDEVVRGTKYWSHCDKVLFLGQSIAYKGNVLFNTLEKAEVPMEQRLELPVMEEVQTGMSTGLALKGMIPVSMYPRFDFLLSGANQLVTHLDKFSLMTNGHVAPKVILKTVVGSIKPLHPGVQHCMDYTEAFKSLLLTVEVIKLEDAGSVFPAYVKALEREDGKSTLIVEMADLYND